MEEFVFEATKDRLILPAENGGTVRLSKGNVVRGKFWLRYVGKGLRRKLEPVAMGMTEAQKKAAKVEPKKEAPKAAPKTEQKAEKKKAAPKAAPKKEKKPEPKEEEGDSLPKSKKELKGMDPKVLKEMAKDLGLKTTGGKDALVDRLAKELGL
jgi:hypothetical protein